VSIDRDIGTFQAINKIVDGSDVLAAREHEKHSKRSIQWSPDFTIRGQQSNTYGQLL
jgi:hypothetical protein